MYTLIFDIKTIHLFQLNKEEGKKREKLMQLLPSSAHIDRGNIGILTLWHCTKRIVVREHKAKGAKVFN